MNFAQNVPLPERMKKLPRDKRGYPIPVIVTRDRDGLPMFTVNDSVVQTKCVHKKMCPICGGKLPKELWFVGGPQSAFHPHGCYFDSAMHHECLTYALQVCPYLAMTRWNAHEANLDHLSSRMDKRTLLEDRTMIVDRPDVFVAVMSYGQSLSANGPMSPHIKPLRPYHAVEFWKHGQRVDFYEGVLLMRKVYSEPKLDLHGTLRLIAKREMELLHGK
jgi:hypothetical protein